MGVLCAAGASTAVGDITAGGDRGEGDIMATVNDPAAVWYPVAVRAIAVPPASPLVVLSSRARLLLVYSRGRCLATLAAKQFRQITAQKSH